jgi:Bacterial protein of unknown function (DUF885)
MLRPHLWRFTSACTVAVLLAGQSSGFQKGARPVTSQEAAPSEFDFSSSEMRPLIQGFAADQQSLARFYNIEDSPERRERFRKFYTDWLARLAPLKFDRMGQDGKVDYIVFRNSLEHDLRALELSEKSDAEARRLLPFSAVITALEVARQKMEPLDPKEAAAKLSKLQTSIEDARKTLDRQLREQTSPDAVRQRKVEAARALAMGGALRDTLRTWFTFYNGYDPLFTWWAAEDYRKADAALQAYTNFLSERVLGLRTAAAAASAGSGVPTAPIGRGGNGARGTFSAPTSTTAQAGDINDIVGNPIGRDALVNELNYEMIPYTPEQLLAIAEKEFAWCEGEMKRASRDMGLGDDWKAALEKVKNMYVEPGKQPEMIRELAVEAIKFVDDHDLVTVPPIARETWRMRMMTPQQQLVNPFFTGGETISVSYPTDSMSYENKLMSMRGNNRPMSKATVFHELIPGHELQGYMAARFKPYRATLGRSAFVTEGWSLYLELLFWDMKFQNTPEERVGALFWHMHRCARIIFSLSFHLGKMTPAECINFLIDRVGFERENAVGEVRRSFNGSYGPLYQAGYLLGGMQLYALHKELVDTGKMTNRQFHDAILRENYIPIEMMRADLTRQPLTRDYKTIWKFRGDIPEQ